LPSIFHICLANSFQLPNEFVEKLFDKS
jgi:hypothetical protein